MIKRSRHNIEGLFFMIEWREVASKDWKLNRVTVHGSSEPDELPPELAKLASDTDTILKGYFQGTIEQLPLDILDFDAYNYSEKRWKILNALRDKVPRGEVITYGDLGKLAGLGPRAGRPVGNVMATNCFAFWYPCHRVVKADYSLGNYGLGGTKVKEHILKLEGVKIQNGICKH